MRSTLSLHKVSLLWGHGQPWTFSVLDEVVQGGDAAVMVWVAGIKACELGVG